ncbi:hypothetical protein [uncultured Bifidobacterium sp.]|uniref:hypothetical protein n=1 Tax=uncultured Bifidobacterium sp. TaxID=165187 RepID=UPI00258F2C6A|nr:hypothetical protein [uncultured Bifidobacterium sp.]
MAYFLRKQKVGDEGLEPFALGFPDRCHSAVFPVFPTVPTWFAIHSNSLQITAITGKVWAKCGHGIIESSVDLWNPVVNLN